LNAAYALDLGDRVGSLAPGYAGDLLILDVPDYRHLGYRFGTNPVTMVVKGGEIVAMNGQMVYT
jgi:imidazolonepropionase